MKFRVWVLLLNWNNGRDTAECLESIRLCTDPEIAGVVVCDNASSDDSCEAIRAWAAGAGVTLPEHQWLDGRFALAGGDVSVGQSATRPHCLIHTGNNLGFAGGNNVGLRWLAVQNAGFDAVFLLNNDTVLEPGAVTAVARRLVADRRVGMAGCTVAYFHQRDRVQAWGGATFARWLARAAHIGAHAPIELVPAVQQVEARLDYVLGAALAISKECLDAVGLMEERYFLYFEEIDWAERARRAGFTLGFARDALVWHKEGGSTGSSADTAKRSLLSEHYLARSAIRFTRKFYPWFLPTVLAYQLLKAAQAVLNGDAGRAWVRLRAVSGLPFVAHAAQ